jgi:hypothetical protein
VGGDEMKSAGEHPTFNIQLPRSKAARVAVQWVLSVECWALNVFRFIRWLFLRPLPVLLTLAGIFPARAQFDGPGSPGVSASLMRLFGTNTAFNAQVEYQLLGRDNKESIGIPMTFARRDNRIRVEIDMARMRNRVRPDTLAQFKPLGIDQIVTILRPDLRASYQVFPKLRALVKLPMPPTEIQAFVKPAKMERTRVGQEKMEGTTCTKYRVVVVDDQGKRHEATVWNAPELRDFPVCVATREGEDTAVIRFRQVQFVRPDAAKFEPPAGYTEYADMEGLMVGPAAKYMMSHKTATPVPKKSTAPATKPKATAGTTTKKK